MLTRITAGTSGFRGRTNTEITPAHALAIGERYGAMLRHRLSRAPKVTVGHDQRFGAQMLAEAVAAGFMASGAKVVMLGCVPTGVYCVGSMGFDGGVLVTGSHMPPDRIGIIPMNADGSYATSEVTDPLTDAVVGYPEERSTVPWGHLGKLVRAPDEKLVERYLDVARSRLGIRRAPKRGTSTLRVLIDPGNGTAGDTAVRFLRVLGYDVKAIHLDPKPVPDRPSECRASSCTRAIDMMRAGEFDLGACFDGDADRVLFIAHDGTPLPEDLIGGIFAKAVLHRGDVCVTPINSGNLIEVVCRGSGATVQYCRIGQPDTGRAIKEFGAAYAYEASAKYGFPREFLWYDAIYAVAKMLGIMERRGKSLAELADELPTFHRVDRNIPLDAARRDEVVARALSTARDVFGGLALRVDDIDGLRFTFDDDSWVLLRPSGTEPLARVYADAPNHERAESLAAEGERIFHEAMAMAA
ncbi:MAG: hypothetical protein Q7S02_05840 [bacterium]|nr:hypothetical protein [bacterium]